MSLLFERHRAEVVLEELRLLMERGCVYQGSGRWLWGRRALLAARAHLKILEQIYSSRKDSLSWEEIMDFEQIKRQCDFVESSDSFRSSIQEEAFSIAIE